jgi:dTDP-D-glucose 4,6-dehydratase
MTVYGDGKQTRSFQYVSDLVRKRWPLRRSSNVALAKFCQSVTNDQFNLQADLSVLVCASPSY